MLGESPNHPVCIHYDTVIGTCPTSARALGAAACFQKNIAHT